MHRRDARLGINGRTSVRAAQTAIRSVVDDKASELAGPLHTSWYWVTTSVDAQSVTLVSLAWQTTRSADAYRANIGAPLIASRLIRLSGLVDARFHFVLVIPGEGPCTHKVRPVRENAPKHHHR